MSTICDTCKREPCSLRMDGLKFCDWYERGETRWEKLFGSPEKAARTFRKINPMHSCSDCMFNDECPTYDDCFYEDSDVLLEWLRGEAE